MATPNTHSPIVAVQVVLVRREGEGATEHVTPDGNVQVMTTSWHEGSPYSCARPGCPAGCDRNDPTTEAPSDVRPSPPARDAELVALLETEIAKREAAEMRANRATADLDALESEDRRQDVQAKHWREVLRIRRELDGIRREMNDVTEIIAEALGYRPSGLPLDGWPHLSTTGDHTPTSLAAEAAGVLAKASRLREGIEALAAEMLSDDECQSCHAVQDEVSTCDHAEGMQRTGDMLRALLAEGDE
jgi:hypothetical protein